MAVYLKPFLTVVVLTVTLAVSALHLPVQQPDSITYYQAQLKQATTKIDSAQTLYSLGLLHGNLNQEHTKFKLLTQALELFTQVDYTKGIMDCNYELYYLVGSQNKLDTDPMPYLDTYYNLTLKHKDSTAMIKALMQYASEETSNSFDGAKNYYDRALALAQKTKDSTQITVIFSRYGNLYSYYDQLDSARYYYNKALKRYPKTDTYRRFITLYNIANSYEKEQNHARAVTYLKQAEAILPNKHKLQLQRLLYRKFLFNYRALGNYTNALNYYDLFVEVKDSIGLNEQNVEISKIKEQYDNEKLRANNLEIEAKRKQNRNWLIGALGLLVFGGVVSVLLQKNTRKKQKLAEQQKDLQSQKLATVLKEQELANIDAMIAGQEKERQHIANDLHDDLGGLMATLKWQFNSLKESITPELYNKTSTMLDDAYNKIRNIAHAKNAGVVANQGLLKAVQQMAQTVSGSNELDVKVKGHNLNTRLENSLELALFRIIQELLTNVIKHAQATEVAIHLTNHNDTLNILVEDNGIGFSPNKTTKTNGMGLNSIEKRVEHLNGSINIESVTGKGTSVIIDVPLV